MGLDGRHVLSPDPVRVTLARAHDDEDFDAVVQPLGFERWTHFGDLTANSMPISIEVYAALPLPSSS
jgi:hypothetical protein